MVYRKGLVQGAKVGAQAGMEKTLPLFVTEPSELALNA